MLQIRPDYWENLLAVFFAFAVLALVIERALYQVFDTKDWKSFEVWIARQAGGDFLDLKPWISVAVSMVIVFQFRLDMIGMLFSADGARTVSLALTGLFVAGGSTGVYKFFRRARKLREAVNAQQVAAAEQPALPGSQADTSGGTP